MMIKIVLLAIAVALTACENRDDEDLGEGERHHHESLQYRKTNAEGEVIECHNGITYVMFYNGSTEKLDKNGNIVPCKE